MGKGWAFVGNYIRGTSGSAGSIQTRVDARTVHGDANFTYDKNNHEVYLSGNLNVSGAINANQFNVDVINKTITNIEQYGSTNFGDSLDDLHVFTGSIEVSGTLTSSYGMLINGDLCAPNIPVGVDNSVVIQDADGCLKTDEIDSRVWGSNLIDATGAPADNQIAIFTDSNTVEGTSELTYDGNILRVTGGEVIVSGDISSSGSIVGVGTSLTLLNASNISQGIIDNARLPPAINVSSLTGGLNASNLEGTIDNARLPAAINVASVAADGSALTNLDAGNINSGILNNNRLPANISITEMTSSKMKLTGISAGTATTSSYLALDSSNNVVLTSSSGGSGGGGESGTIGAAEDGNYNDGLFTDFNSGTSVGTAVDRFNEVLKILAPSPAPAVSRINYTNGAGIAAKLSFGASGPVTHYTSSGTGGGFDAVDVGDIYQSETSGSNERLGIYKKTQTITGEVNFNISNSITNGNYAYTEDSFGNGDAGTLKLELNGTVVHSIDLSSFTGAGNAPNGTDDTGVNGNGSGFVNVSVANSTMDGNGANWGAIFKYRSADYTINPADQLVGWNYLKVIHTIGSTNYPTNYVEWVNDPSGAVNDISATNARIEDINLVGSKYLSGVEYNTNATANYKTDLSNMYRNVYAPSGNPITFTVSNSSTPSPQAVPDLGMSDDNTKTLSITASLNVNAAVNSLVNGVVTANISATHPLKNTLSNGGAATTPSGFLIDNRTLSSTNTIERFHDESYRKTSGVYSNQSSVTDSAATWNSQNHMTSSGATGHTDGLLFYNQRLYSPIDADIPNNGNFSTLSNSPAGNPNYAGVSGTRTFFRVLQNSSGATKRDIKISSTKSGTKYSNSTLDGNDIHFYVKIPGKTGWMDITQNFTYGSISDGDGALINGAGDNSNLTSNNNSVHCITFGTESIANGEYAMLKIEADESWSGYISQLSFQLGASDVSAPTQAPILDDIDANNTGIAAKLSFGSSNNIAGYSNVTGSSISLDDFNSNNFYDVVGDYRRGIFTSKQQLTGTLNEDIGSNGSNYPANSFRNAYTGSLIIEVNGVEKHSIDLSSNQSSISGKNADLDGFEVGAISYSQTSDSIPDYTKPYRVGTYFVGPDSQNLGWNYARVIHRIGASDTTTNYVEWVVDTDSTALAASETLLSNFDNNNIFYQSGVKYFSSAPSASYSYLMANGYRNVYQNGTAITFSSLTNVSVSNVRISGSGVTTRDVSAASSILPNLNNVANCQNHAVEVTGTLLFSPSTSLVGHSDYIGGQVHTASAKSTFKHPIKANLSTAVLQKSGFLVFSASLGSTNENTEEYFNLEHYRRKAHAHNTQFVATGSTNNWNPQADMRTAAGHDDGLLVFNGYLISPLKGGVNGDFRNIDDGGTIQSPSSNVNYSSGQLSNSERTFYRYYRNNTVNDRSSITITIYGSGTLVNKQTSIGANGNFHMEVKIPGNTAWLDGGKAYTSNNKDVDGSGALVGGSSPTTINTGGTSVTNTFNGGSLNGTVSANATGGEVVVIKITAHKDWTGYLSRLKVAYS